MTKARDLANAGTALTTVSATELGYLDGVTSAVQTQINSKIGQAAAINPTIVDAKGDIIAATAADTVARLAVGANDTVLTADSSTATGLKWASVASGGGLTLLSTTTLSGTSVTVSSISGSYKNLILMIKNGNNNAGDSFYYRFNGDTASNYYHSSFRFNGTTQVNYNDFAGSNRLPVLYEQTNQAVNLAQVVTKLYRYTDTDVVYIESNSFAGNSGTSNRQRWDLTGIYDNSAAISSVTVTSSSGTFSGTLYIYGES